jgi:pimeloyl-ACP methyl ester carboxylesterase
MSDDGGSDSAPRIIRVLGRDVRVDVRPGPAKVPPIMLLMGLGGNVEMWEPFRSGLVERTGATTVAFDVPGTGGSPVGCVPWPLAAIGRLTTRVADAVGIGTFDVLGLSWGGLLAQQVALTAPRRVRRVVLTNTNFGWGSLPGSPRALAVLGTTARYRSREALDQARSAFGGLAEPAEQHTAARLARPPSTRGYFHQILALAGWSSLPVLPLIRQPVLVLAGDDDPAIPLPNARLMTRLLPHARLEVLPGGGHLLLFERTSEAVDIVARFLEEAPPGTSKD